MVSRLAYEKLNSDRLTTNVTPFTYRDGVTYLSILNEITVKIRDELIPALTELDGELESRFKVINANFESLAVQWSEQLDMLDPDAVRQLVLDADIPGLNERLDALSASLTVALEQHRADTVTQINSVQAQLTATLNESIQTINDDIGALNSELRQYADSVAESATNAAFAQVVPTVVNALNAPFSTLARASRENIHPVLKWIRGKVVDSRVNTLRIWFAGDSHGNDGSYEIFDPSDVNRFWGGQMGYTYRIANLVNNIGAQEGESGKSPNRLFGQPGIITYESCVAGLVSGNYLSAGTLDNIGAIGPNVVFHMIGTNDCLNGVPVETFKAQLRSRIEAIWTLLPDCRQVLITPWPLANSNWSAYHYAYKAVYDALESTNRIYLLDNGGQYLKLTRPGISDLWNILPDDIHSNRAGHRALADRIMTEIFDLPSPMGHFGAPTAHAEQKFRGGAMSQATPTAQVLIDPAPVPRLVTAHADVLAGVAGGEADLRLGINGIVKPFHVQPGSLASFSCHQAIILPAHQRGDVILAGHAVSPSVINVYANEYSEYNKLTVTCEYV